VGTAAGGDEEYDDDGSEDGEDYGGNAEGGGEIGGGRQKKPKGGVGGGEELTGEVVMLGAFYGGVSELGEEGNYDVEKKCRVMVAELDRANNNPNPFMDCALLTGIHQRYATSDLRLKLATELNALFREQVLERERDGRFLAAAEEAAAAKKNEARMKGHLEERSASLKAANKAGGGVARGDGGARVDSSDSDSDLNDDGGDDNDGDDFFVSPDNPDAGLMAAGGGGGGEDGNPLKKKRLVMRETVRRWEFKEKLERSQAIRNTRAAIGGEGEATKGGGQDLVKDEANSRALAHSQRPDYCAACDSNEGCVWQPCCDVAAIQERQKVLASELHYTRTHSEALTLESYVPLSSMRGGSTSHRRSDLVEELRREGELMGAYLKLNHVDKELHDTCQASKEYVAVSSVHGYASLMWVGDAKKALGSMRDQLIARTLVLEIVDDLLEEMLEGWSFGEKESSFTVCGFVPSVKADGVVRSGGDQRRAVAVAEENRARKEASRKPGEVFDSERDGTAAAKNSGIEESAQQRLQRDHALRVVSDRDHHLSETETTLKFGAFLLALSYFKALTHVRREKASWLGNDDRLEGPVVRPVTDERRRMVGEQKQVEYRRMELERVAKKAARGGEARHKRFKHLREAEVRRFLDEIKAQKSKRKGSVGVQRLYRGHLGRKAAMRWATKRAELEAILALMHGSATTLQRAFRGFVGRMDAAEKRAEMAEFIAMMRMEESAAEEEDYWKENTFERLQRDWSIFWQTSRQVLSNSEALSYNTRTHLLPVQEY